MTEESDVDGDLFTRLDGLPMVFLMGANGEERRRIKTLVETGGGVVMDQNKRVPLEWSSAHDCAMWLVHPNEILLKKDVDMFLTKYVLDCATQNKILPNLEDYRHSRHLPSAYEQHNPLDVLLGRKKWVDMKRRGEGERVSDIEDDDDNVSFLRGPIREGRQVRQWSQYSRKEKQAIVDWLVQEREYNNVKGTVVWKKMEVQGVVKGRTWQSLKEHFRKQIMPEIHNFVKSWRKIRRFRAVFGMDEELEDDTSSSEEEMDHAVNPREPGGRYVATQKEHGGSYVPTGRETTMVTEREHIDARRVKSVKEREQVETPGKRRQIRTPVLSSTPKASTVGSGSGLVEAEEDGRDQGLGGNNPVGRTTGEDRTFAEDRPGVEGVLNTVNVNIRQDVVQGVWNEVVRTEGPLVDSEESVELVLDVVQIAEQKQAEERDIGTKKRRLFSRETSFLDDGSPTTYHVTPVQREKRNCSVTVVDETNEDEVVEVKEAPADTEEFVAGLKEANCGVTDSQQSEEEMGGVTSTQQPLEHKELNIEAQVMEIISEDNENKDVGEGLNESINLLGEALEESDGVELVLSISPDLTDEESKDSEEKTFNDKICSNALQPPETIDAIFGIDESFERRILNSTGQSVYINSQETPSEIAPSQSPPRKKFKSKKVQRVTRRSTKNLETSSTTNLTFFDERPNTDGVKPSEHTSSTPSVESNDGDEFSSQNRSKEEAERALINLHEDIVRPVRVDVNRYRVETPVSKVQLGRRVSTSSNEEADSAMIDLHTPKDKVRPVQVEIKRYRVKTPESRVQLGRRISVKSPEIQVSRSPSPLKQMLLTGHEMMLAKSPSCACCTNISTYSGTTKSGGHAMMLNQSPKCAACLETRKSRSRSASQEGVQVVNESSSLEASDPLNNALQESLLVQDVGTDSSSQSPGGSQNQTREIPRKEKILRNPVSDYNVPKTVIGINSVPQPDTSEEKGKDAANSSNESIDEFETDDRPSEAVVDKENSLQPGSSMERSDKGRNIRKENSPQHGPSKERYDKGRNIRDDSSESEMEEVSPPPESSRTIGHPVSKEDRELWFRKKHRVPYSQGEEEAIINYLVQHGGYGVRGGNVIWKQMEHSWVCPGRTWQSLKERFNKHINNKLALFNMNRTRLSEADEKVKIEAVTRPRSMSPTPSTRDEEGGDNTTVVNRGEVRRPYSDSEDINILNFIAENKRFGDAGGNTLWKLMEERGVVTNRTWHSLKERFRKNLLKRLRGGASFPGITKEVRRQFVQGGKHLSKGKQKRLNSRD